jgi:hypothetical protein
VSVLNLQGLLLLSLQKLKCACAAHLVSFLVTSPTTWKQLCDRNLLRHPEILVMRSSFLVTGDSYRWVVLACSERTVDLNNNTRSGNVAQH